VYTDYLLAVILKFAISARLFVKGRCHTVCDIVYQGYYCARQRRGEINHVSGSSRDFPVTCELRHVQVCLVVVGGFVAENINLRTHTSARWGRGERWEESGEAGTCERVDVTAR